MKDDIRTSVLVSKEFYHLSKVYKIKFSEALRVGFSLLLAEKGLKEYDNNLNISRRLTLLQNRLEAQNKELYELRETIKERRWNTRK